MNRKLRAFLFAVAILGVLVGALFLPALRPVEMKGVQTGGAQHADMPGMQAGSEMKMIPEELAGLKLQHQMSGEEAVQDISKLHGTNIEVVNGYIAQYSDGRREAFLWISESKDEADAKMLLEAMDAKMPRSPVFGNHRTEEKGGRTYHYVDGAGMQNYYWQQDHLVVWIGVKGGEEDTKAVLAATIEALEKH